MPHKWSDREVIESDEPLQKLLEELQQMGAPQTLLKKWSEARFSHPTLMKVVLLDVLRNARAYRYLEAGLTLECGIEGIPLPSSLMPPPGEAEQSYMKPPKLGGVKEDDPMSTWVKISAVVGALVAVLGLAGGFFLWVDSQTTAIAVNGKAIEASAQAVIGLEARLGTTFGKLDQTLERLDGTLDRIDRNQVRLASALGAQVEVPNN
jgi:hypothetical protein